MTQSSYYGSKAVRLQSVLTLSKKELALDDYNIVSEVCSRLLDEGFSETLLLEYLLDSYSMANDKEGLISAVDKYVVPLVSTTSTERVKRLGITIKSSPKIEYYRFLTRLYAGGNSIPSSFRDFLIDNPSSKLTEVVYTQVKEAGIVLPKSTSLLADFKSQIFDREYSAAGQSMVDILRTQKEKISDILNKGYIVDEVSLTPIILGELYKAAVASGRIGDLLKSIKGILSLPGNRGYEIGEVYSYQLISGLYRTQGYLERRAANYKAAANSFLTSSGYASRSDREKMLWYWFNSLIHYSPSEAVRQIKYLSGLWFDPDYYNDIFSELATIFVQRGQWIEIQKVLDIIQHNGPDDSVSKYAYLTARAGMNSYIAMDKTEITRLLTLSYQSGYGLASGLYYRILAGNLLNISSNKSIPWMFNENVSKQPSPVTNEMDGSETLVFGWIKYGKIMDAYKYLMSNSFSDFELVRETAEKLLENRKYAQSIRLISRFSRFKGFNLELSDLLLVYPDAYKEDITEISRLEGISSYVFSALVREESHFQSNIVSSAGAVGLSQLMPETAAEVAERLRKKSYNLKDTRTNLSFGGWYLGNLVRHTDVLMDSLFAYNGGLSRVRQWRETYPNLPDDLFLEAVPFKETSHYGRKVLVSSVIYGYLYDNLQPEEIVNHFYRN